MRKKIKELYEHSTLVAKIRYSYLCLLVPFVLFLIFCFYNLWNNNRRYEDMINSSVMASQFSLDFQKDFDYETYLLIVGNKTLEESSLHDMLVEADGIVAGLEELTESQENLKRLTSVKKYLNNLETYIGRIEDNIREGNRYEDNMEIWENDVQIVTSLVGDWNGFDLSAFFQGSFGADVFDALRRYELAAVNYTSDALERWTGPGTSNSMPRIVLGDTPKNFRPSTLLVHDASFLRLRNLQVGYTLPAQLTRKAYIQRLRFYASFDNLLTITGYKGMDPEIGSTMGIDKGVYPQARVYTFGLNLTF